MHQLIQFNELNVLQCLYELKSFDNFLFFHEFKFWRDSVNWRVDCALKNAVYRIQTSVVESTHVSQESLENK